MLVSKLQIDKWFVYHKPTTDEEWAEKLYNTWHDQPGWVPWAPGGNSDMQDRARAATVGLGTKGKHTRLQARILYQHTSILQGFYENLGNQAMYDLINAEAKQTVLLIDELAPDCADKSAAIRCVLLGKMLYNKSVTSGTSQARYLIRAEEQMELAEMQANKAIACCGV